MPRLAITPQSPRSLPGSRHRFIARYRTGRGNPHGLAQHCIANDAMGFRWLGPGALAAIGALLLGLTRAQLLQHTHHEAAALAASAGSEIQARIDRAAISAQMLATIVATSQERVELPLHDTMQANHDIDGQAAVFRPSSNPLDVPRFSPFVSHMDNGALASRDLSSDARPYWNSNWSPGGLGCSAGCWQRPFLALSRQRQLINHSVAISQEGHPIGIINADVTRRRRPSSRAANAPSPRAPAGPVS